MKIITAVLAGLLLTSAASAQQPGTLQWNASAHAAAKLGEYVVSLQGVVEHGWHVYAFHQSDGGPLPLVVRLENDAPYVLSGAITGTRATKHHDASFNLDTEYFTEAFQLAVPVRTSNAGSHEVPLAVRYQMCSDTTCMPPRTVHLVAKVS